MIRIFLCSSTRTCIILFWINIFEIFAINFGPVLFKMLRGTTRRSDHKLCIGAIVTMIMLISTLIHKPHNIFLNALLLFTCAKVNSTIRTLFKHQSYDTILLIATVAHFWIGKCFFFYQGNSNSLASIDLNAGYVGLSHFNFAAVTIMLTINTYSGPILAFLVLIYHEIDADHDHTTTRSSAGHENKYTSNVSGVLSILSILIAFPISFYYFIVILFRNHLFVWSVFSPKLLYEVYHLVLMSLLFCWTTSISNVVK